MAHCTLTTKNLQTHTKTLQSPKKEGCFSWAYTTRAHNKSKKGSTHKAVRATYVEGVAVGNAVAGWMAMDWEVVEGM
eukprot:1104773-Pelagomonas_calceolata.AAC.1